MLHESVRLAPRIGPPEVRPSKAGPADWLERWGAYGRADTSQTERAEEIDVAQNAGERFGFRHVRVATITSEHALPHRPSLDLPVLLPTVGRWSTALNGAVVGGPIPGSGAAGIRA